VIDIHDEGEEVSVPITEGGDEAEHPLGAQGNDQDQAVEVGAAQVVVAADIMGGENTPHQSALHGDDHQTALAGTGDLPAMVLEDHIAHILPCAAPEGMEALQIVGRHETSPMVPV
jgi:hypothetical protein